MNTIALAGLLAMLALLPSAAGAQSPPANAPARSFALPPLPELRATRERPLFSPSRRPEAEAAPAPDAGPVEESPDSLPFELTGVVMGTDVAIAILRNRDTQETVQLRRGETLEAWSIEEIAARHVVLRQEDRQVRLELFPAKAEGAAPAPPSPLASAPPSLRPNPNRMNTPQFRRSAQPNSQQRRPPRRGTPPTRRQEP
jgi:type II secretory pathway component PulC